jgi:DNA-binding NarL/FixJ family response regulator
LQFAGSVAQVADALEVLHRVRPDIVLIDGSSGMTPALSLLSNPRAISPDTRAVLWVVELPEMDASRALQMGIRASSGITCQWPN